jgi:signal transduction histidine kinase
LKENPRLDSFDQELFMNNDIHYFQIEITPLYTPNSNVLWGFLLFFKDTTQIRKANEIIHRNQTMLIEQQHLASLGQLIGGIAHNMRTPIMSISGGLEALRDLVHEYELSIGDNTVTENDHREIASEMIEWIQKTKPFCSYMSDIISTVKDQAVRLNDSSMSKFTVSELLKRIDLLMKHELKIGHCILLIDNRMPEDTELPGTMNNMIQIIGNIIVNAIEAYEDTQGRIELIVEECSSLPGNTRISIRDYGPGLPEHLRERVFKEMTTTKGKKGTGLGLYLSYLTIKGKFGGTMWFDTVTSQGTTFHISVPTIKTGTMTGGKYNEEKTG